MKRIFLAVALTAAAASAQADAGFMVGIAYNFDGRAAPSGLGFTAKVLTSDHEDKWVGAAGVSYFPWSQQRFGVDVGAGYTWQNATALISYDFLHRSPQLSAGWTDPDE